MKSFLKNSNLCDHNSPTLQTDRQTTCDRNTALCTKVHRAVKKDMTVLHPAAPGIWLRILFMSFHFNKARPPDVTVTQASSYNLHCHRARQGGNPTGSMLGCQSRQVRALFKFKLPTAGRRCLDYHTKECFFLTRSLRQVLLLPQPSRNDCMFRHQSDWMLVELLAVRSSVFC